jgi:hypothetical protein
MPSWFPGLLVAIVMGGVSWVLVGSQRGKIRADTSAVIDKRWKDIADATDAQNEKLIARVSFLEKQVAELQTRVTLEVEHGAKQARVILALREGIGLLIAQMKKAGLLPCWDGTVPEE